jgi:hypothetical protein
VYSIDEIGLNLQHITVNNGKTSTKKISSIIMCVLFNFLGGFEVIFLNFNYHNSKLPPQLKKINNADNLYYCRVASILHRDR